MKSIALYAGVSVLLFSTGIGCVDSSQDKAGDEGQIGTLVLPLVAKAESGTQYKLRDAVFDVVPNPYYWPCDPYTGMCKGPIYIQSTPVIIQGDAAVTTAIAVSNRDAGSGGAAGSAPTEGSVPLVLTSEDDPDATSIEAELEESSYYISLRTGWRMEKIVDGEAQPVEATLLNANYQWVYVNRHQTSTVAFEFGIGDRSIWLDGKLHVDINVYEDPDYYYGPWKMQAPQTTAACKAMAYEYSADYAGPQTDCLCNKCMWDYGTCMVDAECDSIIKCGLDNGCADTNCLMTACEDLVSSWSNAVYTAYYLTDCGSREQCFPQTDGEPAAGEKPIK